MERIHVFVPVYHREVTVRKCAEALLNTFHSPGYEVLVVFVDNRSEDSLREYLKGLAASNSNVKAILLKSNIGKAKAITHASKTYPNFNWFVSCDSDIFHLTPGWPGILTDCYKEIKRAGMVSVEYVNNSNNPMPRQPTETEIQVGGRKYVFRWGGQVAGGCFVTQAAVWHDVGYRGSGVYGGIDGLFRQSVAESLLRKCGYIVGVLADHFDDREENKDYHSWKLDVQGRIKKHSPLASAKVLGNERGFWDR